MAISRTPMVDDDGTGTTGTIFNNTWKAELYNQIDGLDGPILGTATIATGQIDNLNPAGGPQAKIWLVTASVSTYLTGIVAEPDGRMHLLINNGSSLIILAHLFASASANQFIGAGYANTNLAPWKSLWITYSTGYSKWIVLAP